MRVFVCDKFEQSGLNGLKTIGCEVLYRPELKDEAAFIAEVQQAKPDVLVVRSTHITANMLDACPIKLIVRAGAGCNTIDVIAASKRGIYVSNCPGKNSIAVAELAFALILALDRQIADNVIALRKGEWNKKAFSKANGLYGRTLGLIGLGNIGLEMIPRAHAFGMSVAAWSRSLTPEHAAHLGIEYQKDIILLARATDIVSVHVALLPETKGLLGNAFFNAMRAGACFINTSRGEVVDQAALHCAMRERRIRVGLDVYSTEPSSNIGNFTDPIAQEPNFYGTHHIGASTEQAQEAIAAEVIRIIQVFKTTGKAPNTVNLARRTPATHTLVVRHRDRPGVLASVLGAIRAANINVQEMENIIFEGAEAAVAYINLDKAPSPESLDYLRTHSLDMIEMDLFKI